MVNIPEVDKEYYCFDDGKVSIGRRYAVVVSEVIDFNDIDAETLAVWYDEVKSCPWLYNAETDVFVKTLNNDGNEVFVRDINMGWFGIGGSLCCGRLDIDGKLNARLTT